LPGGEGTRRILGRYLLQAIAEGLDRLGESALPEEQACEAESGPGQFVVEPDGLAVLVGGMAPRLKTSQRSSMRPTSPRACSGGMYASVPSQRSASDAPLPAAAPSTDGPSAFRSSTLASPQSMTWTSPKAPTMTFSGFRSRWMTPLLWA